MLGIEPGGACLFSEKTVDMHQRKTGSSVVRSPV